MGFYQDILIELKKEDFASKSWTKTKRDLAQKNLLFKFPIYF